MFELPVISSLICHSTCHEYSLGLYSSGRIRADPGRIGCGSDNPSGYRCPRRRIYLHQDLHPFPFLSSPNYLPLSTFSPSLALHSKYILELSNHITSEFTSPSICYCQIVTSIQSISCRPYRTYPHLCQVSSTEVSPSKSSK